MALVQVARGLTHIHPQHIVHLDIRPENILVRSNTRDDGDIDLHVVLADFGQALPGAASPSQVSSRIPADMVNSMVYRPLHLRRSAPCLCQFGTTLIVGLSDACSSTCYNHLAVSAAPLGVLYACARPCRNPMTSKLSSAFAIADFSNLRCLASDP